MWRSLPSLALACLSLTSSASSLPRCCTRAVYLGCCRTRSLAECRTSPSGSFWLGRSAVTGPTVTAPLTSDGAERIPRRLLARRGTSLRPSEFRGNLPEDEPALHIERACQRVAFTD